MLYEVITHPARFGHPLYWQGFDGHGLLQMQIGGMALQQMHFAADTEFDSVDPA